MLGLLEDSLSDMQGKLFESSCDKGYDSQSFIKAFMTSDIAQRLDHNFNHLQWAGKEYILEEMEKELRLQLKTGGEIYDKETLYWIGYLYRGWHYYTGEDSKQIYKQADAKTLRKLFLPYHAMSIEMAIDRLKETYKDKHK